MTSGREEIKSWITIKPSSRTKFLKPYSNSYKTFKDSFVRIDFIAPEGRPFWFSEDDVVDPPVYWEKDHYDFSVEHFSISAQRLSEADANFGDLLMQSAETVIFKVQHLLGSMKVAYNYIKGGRLICSQGILLLAFLLTCSFYCFNPGDMASTSFARAIQRMAVVEKALIPNPVMLAEITPNTVAVKVPVQGGAKKGEDKEARDRDRERMLKNPIDTRSGLPETPILRLR